MAAYIKFSISRKNRKWWVLTAISAILAMLNLDHTAVAVTLPQLHRDLGIDEVMQQWVINSYLLMLGVLMIAGGKISDAIGNRRAFFIGLYGFLLASFFCGIAANGYILILARTLQGIFGAILIPNTAVVILNAFPEDEQGTAIGIYAGIAAVFLAIGPLLGGVLTQFLSWRLVFLLNIPIGFFSAFLALRTIPRFKKKLERKVFTDWLGLGVLIVASSSLLFAIMNGVSFGWTSPLIISLEVVGVCGSIVFIILESKVANPFVDLKVFKYKSYLFTTVISMFVQMGIVSRVFWTVFLQVGLGKSPLIAGLLMMPSTALALFFAPLSGRLMDKFGPRLPMTIGMFSSAVGLLWISIFALTLNFLQVIVGTLIAGVGLAMTSNISSVVLAEIPKEERGVAYSVYQQVRQMGGTIGVAIMGAVISNLNVYYFTDKIKSVGLPASIDFTVEDVLLKTSNAASELTKIPPNLFAIINKAALYSYAHAFCFSMLAVCIFAALGLYFSVFKLKDRQQR